MAYESGTASQVNGNIKETATYGVDSSGFGYSVITDDIKADFNFLVNDLPAKLDEVQNHINKAAENVDGFYVENGSRVNSLVKAGEELSRDIANLKTQLGELYQAFMTDIDNVNYELEYNFGWIIIGDVKGATRTETIQTENSGN